MVPSPSIIFSFIVATLYGAAFHLFAGGDARRLALFLLAAWLGFGLGHAVGGVIDIGWAKIGPLHMLPATVGAWIALAVAHVLTHQAPRRKSAR